MLFRSYDMAMLTEPAIMDALRTVQEPELGRAIVTLGMVRDVRITGMDVAFTIELTTPACPLKDEIEANVRSALGAIGAGAGAAAGTGAQMATKGQRVRVPSEARLTFTLQQAADLTGKRLQPGRAHATPRQARRGRSDRRRPPSEPEPRLEGREVAPAHVDPQPGPGPSSGYTYLHRNNSLIYIYTRY